ncbi:inovirus-type Gp2 protein [Halomonas aquamarina]|uniref:hypothetical protein n=1 Tax=Vreelandella aquamarina TaxID=77097 RepID=UPI0023590B3C|nr:hypothetical protein [Halomonas aquamarina]MDC8443672.1 inovirus-type Gp2 protein [Halomonas aquamarina]
MPPSNPPCLLYVNDVRVLASLKQGSDLESSYRYERVTLEKLQLTEHLMHDIAEGPALDLSRQDEFVLHRPGNHHIEAQYVVNNRGRLSLLHKAWDDLHEVLKYIPVAHLSPRTQAFDQVFRQPDHLLESTKAHHSAIQQAVADSRLAGIGRPKEAFHSPLWPPTQKLTFTEKEAQEFLSTTNQYLRHLSAVLKHADVKKAQRSRQKQAEKHQSTLQLLFKKTLEFASPVLLIYLDLEAPNISEMNGVEASYDEGLENESKQAYMQLNEARKAFLKPRNHAALFNGLISYAWKYRYSKGRGLTCMMVLFYDANRETQRYSLTHALGNHWKSVAGIGSNYSSPTSSTNNVAKEQYFGLLEADDPDTKAGLEVLARFMGLYQLYVKPTAPKYMNTFDTSRIPGLTNSKRKRRRRKSKQANKTANEPPENASETQGKEQ